MDPNKFRAAYQRLVTLDEVSTHKIRPARASMRRPTPEELDARQKDLAQYTLQLREIVQELAEAIAARPPKA